MIFKLLAGTALNEREDADAPSKVNLNSKYYCCQKPNLRLLGIKSKPFLSK
jgi:hypothetical protein